MRRLVFGLLVLAACGTASAQPPPGLPTPRISSVFPPGAKAGPPLEVSKLGFVFQFDTEVTILGSDLDEPERLIFSHPAIKGEFIAPPAPPVDPKKKDMPPTKANPNPNGPHKFKVTIPADVPPGTYDLRVVSKYGVSNPRAFVVGNLDEVYEREPNNDVPDAQRVAIGTTINGVISSPTDVDYSVFAGKKGQRVIVSCLSSSIDGRATPMIEIYDTSGRKLATNRNYKDTDALADVILPTDGDYFVRLFQFAYQGGSPDFVYRLTISTTPWIDAVFPPVIEAGKPAQVTLYGRNLPNGQPADGVAFEGRPLEKLSVTINPPTDALATTSLSFRGGHIDPVIALQDGFEYVFKGPNGVSNPVPIYFTREKQVLKKNAGGSTAATAETIPTPCEVSGFIGRRGDSDWYSFDAKKGEQLLVEVVAERVGTQADFFFSVRDGKDPKRDISGEQDDDPDSLHPFGFFTRSADPPPYKFTAPEDGKYLVLVGCREASVMYGPRTAYRLRVSPAKPDFRAVAMPYSRHYQTGASVWQGGNTAYDIYLHRIDGYNGSVTVTAEGLPAGVTAKPVTIGPGARWGVLVLNSTPTAAAFVGPISVKATGTTPSGQPLVREVRPASITWGLNTQQQQAPVISRLDQGFIFAVSAEKGVFTLTAEPASATIKVNMKDEKLPAPLTVKQGEKFTMPVKVNWLYKDKEPVVLNAEATSPSPQATPITVQIPTQPTKEKPEGVLNFDVKSNAAPGVYSITIKGVAQVPFAKPAAGGAMAKGAPLPVEAFADPIEIIVLPSALAKITPGALPGNTLKIGTPGEMVIKIDRLHDFTGEYKVKFAAPMGVAGITAEDVTIPAGKDEVKLVLKAAADAKPGAVANAIITVTAVYEKKHTITHEAKVNFTVAAAK
jgi:hypothetical protein